MAEEESTQKVSSLNVRDKLATIAVIFETDMPPSAEESQDSCADEVPPCPESVQNVDTDEEEIFAEKAILFRFATEATEWLTRGQGVLKILKNKGTGRHRILMRQSQTYKVRANHHIPHLGSLLYRDGHDQEFYWTAFDYTDTEETRELFAVRLASPKVSAAFKAAFEAGQTANKCPPEQ
jgi:hypothetical protein